jgi:hypothetical protein
MNSMKKLLYARGEFIYVQWCCLREASSDSQNADEAPRTPPKIPTATRILAYRSHNEGHRPSTINQGFSPLHHHQERLLIETPHRLRLASTQQNLCTIIPIDRTCTGTSMDHSYLDVPRGCVSKQSLYCVRRVDHLLGSFRLDRCVHS